MTHSIYWHCATYAPDAAGYRPAIEHKLIALAGIEIFGEEDDNGIGLDTHVWGAMSDNPRKLLRKFNGSIGLHDRPVSLYGSNFGMPVMWANAMRHQYPLQVNPRSSGMAVDLATEIGNLVAPSNGLTFESILDLMGLPKRPEMDICGLWESGKKNKQQRITKRLIVDCCFIALVDIRLQFACGNVGYHYAQNFTQAVLEAASEKVPNVGRVFRALLNPDENVANATEVEETPTEPEEVTQVTVAAPDDPEQDPDYDDLDEDEQDEPQDVVAHMDDLDLQDYSVEDDEDDDGLDF